MTTNYHITMNALEVRVPGTTDIDDCGTMDFHFDLQLFFAVRVMISKYQF